MNTNEDHVQEQEWDVLFERISAILKRLQQQNGFGDSDYYILDDNWGWRRQEIEIRNLNLLKPHVVRALQTLLVDYPNWEIAMGVDTMEKYKGWPRMGLMIWGDEIGDALQCQYFPQELQSLNYEGRVRKLETRD